MMRPSTPNSNSTTLAVILRPVRSTEVPCLARWMADWENYPWLDSGRGVQALPPALISLMLQRHGHVLRVFALEPQADPIGLDALSHVDRGFMTASRWCVLGAKSYGRRGYATRAVSKLLTLGFGELALGAVNAWTVEHHRLSICILEHNHFRLIGRQRQCP